MHIEILSAEAGASVTGQPSSMQLAGGEPGRIRPAAGLRRGLAADTVRPIAASDASAPRRPALLVQVDGQTVVEMAGLRQGPGVVLEGGGWMPAEDTPAQPADRPSAPSFFGQSTNDRTPLLGGTAEAGSLVLVGVGDAVFCVTASAEGGWSLDTSTARPMSGNFDLGADGAKTLLVTSIDAAGNSSGIAGVFTLQTSVPVPPILWSLAVCSAMPVLAGWAEPGCTVMIGTGGAIYSAVAGKDGGWRVDTATTQPASGKLNLGGDGVKNVAMACTDAAGNSSTSEARLTLDTASSARAARAAVTLMESEPARSPARESAPLLSGMAGVTRSALSAFGARLERPQQQRRG